MHHAPLLRTADQASVLEYAQMLHEAGQRHAMRLREFHDCHAATTEGFQHRPARGIGQRGKYSVERIGNILNHKVQY